MPDRKFVGKNRPVEWISDGLSLKTISTPARNPTFPRLLDAPAGSATGRFVSSRYAIDPAFANSPPNVTLCKANVSDPGSAGIGAAPIAIEAATPLRASVHTARIGPFSMFSAAPVDSRWASGDATLPPDVASWLEALADAHSKHPAPEGWRRRSA